MQEGGAHSDRLDDLWRRLGRAPNRLVGVGFAAQGFAGARGYAKRAAAGEEVDRADPRLGTPAHALVLASSEPFGPEMLKRKEEYLAAVPPDPADPDVRADLVFFETPAGGAVFSTGSIAWAGSLAHDGYRNDVSRITGKVLRRFLDPEPFVWKE
jgi:N,N-dimethylformamidase